MKKAKIGSIGLSLLVILVLVVWMATGDVKVASNEAPPEPEPAQRGLTRVEVETLEATTYQPTLKLQGQLEPWQAVNVSARAVGTVEQLHVRLGDQVKAGTPLLTLSSDGRGAMVDRWRANIKKLEADLEGARRLRARNLASETEVLRLESELAAARSEFIAAEQIVEHLKPVAPFDGVVNLRNIDPGTLVQVGDPLFELVQVDRLKATGRIPQQSVSTVQPGQAVEVSLLDGTRLGGVVSFVASSADPATRSFAVEILVENPDLLRAAGGTATLNIRLPEQRAQFISPAYLSLDDDGRPGVKYVNGQNEVAFRNVTLLSVTTKGSWVTGLPDEVRLITRGGGFVLPGQAVEPVDRADQRG